MKKACILLLFAALTVLCLTPGRSYAQNDTLVVYATPTDLNDAITRDTLANGAFQHKVYKLVSLDTTYVFNAAVTVHSSISVVGVVDPTTKRPPCIQPIDPGDGSVPPIAFNFVTSGTKGVFKNLYVLSRSTMNTQNLPAACAIQVAADSVSIWIDKCVFEGWAEFVVGYSGNWDDFFITNSKFRNMVHPNQWYVGEVLRNLWPGAAYTDSVVMRYNTFFAMNGYAAAPVTKYYERYFEFTHNTLAYTFKNPFFIFNVVNAKINNNIFYAPWAGGIALGEYPWWDQLWSPEIGSVIDMDALDSAKAAMVVPSMVGQPAAQLIAAAEIQRTVEVKNNAYFWPSALMNYWTAWNDTAHVDSIYTVTWMNARTTNMFSDPVQWPGFVQSGNQNVDPQFGASVQNVLTQAQQGATSSLLDWFKACRAGTLTTTVWGLGVSAPDNTPNWVPQWPLAEAAAMAYTNTAVMNSSTDGLPLGDPNWFTVQGSTGVAQISPVPLEFALQQNYPNPFNPSTTIRYSLNSSGVTSVKIYNVLGQLVNTVVNNVHQDAGTYTVSVDMSREASGMYVTILEQGSRRAIQKMMLTK
jgi:hypothetical protein